MDGAEQLTKKAEERQALLSSSIAIGSPSASSTALKPRGTFGSDSGPDVSIFASQALPHTNEHRRLAEILAKSRNLRCCA